MHFSFCRCNYSIYLIVSRLRFKSTKLIFTRFTPPILTISALLKHPFFTDCKYNVFIWFLYLDEPLNYILTCGYQGQLLKIRGTQYRMYYWHQPQSWLREKVQRKSWQNNYRLYFRYYLYFVSCGYDWTNSTNLVENYNMQIFKGI